MAQGWSRAGCAGIGVAYWKWAIKDIEDGANTLRIGVMTGKPRPNHAVYLRVLSAMTPEQRLRKAFELGAAARALFEHGLRQRFPGMEDAAFRRLLRDRLDRCHNRNY